MKSSPALYGYEKVKMTDRDCDEVSRVVTSICGVKLGLSKKTMIQSRLDKRLIDLNIFSYQEYLNYLKINPNELEFLINAITTNKTEFLREQEHFNILSEIVEKQYYLKNMTQPLYVWSAACSAGQEVYSLAMNLEQIKTKIKNFSYKILGSDIDSSILQIASQAIYSKQEISVLPERYISSYLDRGVGSNSGFYRIKDNLKSHVKYRQHNLIDENNCIGVKFDIIFLRNVLIYFELENIQIVIDKLSRHLVQGGYLFVGHSESLNSIKHKLKPMSGSIYQKVDND